METSILIISVCLPLLLMAVVFYAVFPNMAAGGQIFDDFIIENVSSSGGDKSAELLLFRLLSISCIILTALLVTGLYRIYTRRYASSGLQKAELQGADHAPVRNRFLSFFTNYGIPFLYTYLLSYYAFLAGLTILVQFSPRFSPGKTALLGGALLIAALFFLISRMRFLDLNQILLVLQCFVPFLLVLFFVDRYFYHGILMRIPYAPMYYVCFGGLLLTFFLLSLRHCAKNIKQTGSLSFEKLVHPVTAITVFIYNSYSACPMYAQPDQHHHGEQLIPWQQIISLGQTPYEDYTPVSGLFPLVNGFIQNVLLGGTVSDYSPAISIMVVMFCILTMYLLCHHVGGTYGLLFAVCFALPAYNRQYMLLPVLLLLFSKKLIERSGQWLKFWILSCFLAGLYYPLYGAAALIATLPLGLSVLTRYVRETEWKKEWKRPGWYISWGLCLLPVFLCIPLLLRMVSHTLVYSGQTTLADGICLYGQSAPDFFLPTLIGHHDFLRLRLYYIVRFFLPMLPFAIGTALLFFAWLKHRKEKTTEFRLFLFGLIGMMLALAVSYTYTLVRADVNMLLSRTAPVLVSVFGMFLPVLLFCYGKKLLTPATRWLTTLFCFCLPLILYPQVSAMKFPDMWIYPNGEAELILDDKDKLFSYYEVPEIFLSMQEIVEENNLPDTSMLGNGFMVSDQVHYLTAYASVMEKCKNAGLDPTYLGMDGQGFYYYLNAKACATGYIQAGKSYEAQQRLLATIREKKPVIFLLDPQASYHIYYWVLTSGEYLYCAQDGAFYPAPVFRALYPEHTEGDDMRLVFGATDLGLSPSSFGNSFDTLLPRMETPALTSGSELSGPEPFVADTDTVVSGKIYDLLHLTLPDAAIPGAVTVRITFASSGLCHKHASVTCKTGGGNLLIPMGMNAFWLLGDNTDIRLHFLDEAENLLAEFPLTQAGDHGISHEFYQIKK